VRRREFITGLGAAAWPLATRGQQSNFPVVGYPETGAKEPAQALQNAFTKALADAGFTEGKN
jgi:hypothetical protein